MAMTTMPSGLTLLRAEGAFRSVMPSTLSHGPFSDPANTLVPVNSDLIPPALNQAFSIPRVDFDQACTSAHGSRVAAPFRMPLPFLGDSSEAHVPASSMRVNPAPEASPPVCTGGCPAGSQGNAVGVASGNAMPEPLPMTAMLEEQPHGCLDDTKPMHKPRVVWTEELHQRFLRAIDAAGSEEAAVPTVILKLMNVSGLSRDNVASHLQKHRLGLKRGKSRKRRAPAANIAKNKQVKAVESCTDELHLPEPGAMDNNADPVAADEGPATHRIHRHANSQAIKRRNNAAGEGEGQDCAGSNERDGPSSDDGVGAGSDDGAGAGSDNRNSACNVSAAELDVQRVSSAAEPAQPGMPTADGGNKTQGSGEPALMKHAANTAGQQEGSGGSKGSRSPDASRSGSNNASKQVGNSNGVSDMHGPPTAGSGTGLDAQRLNVTGTRSVVPGALRGSPVSGAVAGAVVTSSAMVAPSSECTRPNQDRCHRSGSTPPDLSTVPPVGVPMSLPVPPQVPAANAELMRAPRLGDESLGTW